MVRARAASQQTIEADDPEDARSPSAPPEAEREPIRLRFPRHVSSANAAAASEEVARVLLSGGRPRVIVADLLEVESFDPTAPIAALTGARRATHLIARVDLIVRHRVVRLAALAAVRVLGLPCTIRAER